MKHPCKGCIHWRALSGVNKSRMYACHCILDTGMRANAFRKGKRVSEHCDFRMEGREENYAFSWRNPKKEEKPKEPKKKGPVPQIYVIMSHDGQEKARGTYEECAEIMGVKMNTVQQWACNMRHGRSAPYRVELLAKT